MILSFPIAAGGIALAKPLITVLFGQEYAPAIVLMQAIFIPFATRGVIHAVTSVIYGIQEPVFLLKVGVVLIVLSVGLNLWLIPIYGAMGAVIATSIPRILALPLYIRFVSKKIKTKWPMNDTIRLTIASAIMGVVVFVIQYFTNNILGLVIGLPVGIIIYTAGLLVLGLVKQQDLKILKQFEKRLPSIFKNSYVFITNVMSKFVRND
jgi:O-antigen/teichoic acid export membrane protein